MPLGLVPLSRCENVKRVALWHMFQRVLDMLEDEEVLRTADVWQVWNTIINNGSKVEDQRLRDKDFAWYSSTNRLLVHDIVKDIARLIYGQRYAKKQCVYRMVPGFV